MRIIGVIDLLRGRAVHARAGQRHQYAPIEGVSSGRIRPGHALDLARVYVERLGVPELYVADLDAIQGGVLQEDLVRDLASLGIPLWLDAGTRSAVDAHRALDLGATQVVVGLETLPSFDALAEICNVVQGPPHAGVAFSLDLRDGHPILDPRGSIAASTPVEAIAAKAVAAGAGTTIVIDLARVGIGSGIDAALIARIHAAMPSGRLVAGGGIRHSDDLERLRQCGCDGALVATALHDGAINAEDVARSAALGLLPIHREREQDVPGHEADGAVP